LLGIFIPLICCCTFHVLMSWDDALCLWNQPQTHLLPYDYVARNVSFITITVGVGGPGCGGVDYVFGVRDVARATSLTPNTQSTPPHPRPPTYYNIRTIHHIAVNHSLMLLKMGKRLPETC
jgi:hypothetical protein